MASRYSIRGTRRTVGVAVRCAGWATSSAWAVAGLRIASVHRVELENAAIRGHLIRMVQVDPVDETDEEEAEREAARIRCEDVAEEVDSLRRVELGRRDLFPVPTLDDRRAAGGAKVAHPVDLAPGSPDEAPPIDSEDRDRRRAKQAALPAANDDEPVRAQRHAMFQEKPEDRPEELDCYRDAQLWGVGT